jgi:hypothetical protein
MQERMEESRMSEITREERKRLTERERELMQYREIIEKQAQELDEYRSRLKKDQFEREKFFQHELEEREKLFVEREKKLFERQREFETHLMHRQAEAEALRAHLEKEVATREAKLQQALVELQQEKERYNEESRKKIERTSKDYVVDALDILDRKEKQFHLISKVWSAVGAIALIAGLLFFAYVTISSVISIPSPVTWEFITFSIVKGLIAIALLAGLAKYAFLFSNSYMREALKNADRRHAINFGKFYLESYGAAADWSQVKEAFEHWNIAAANAFTRPDDLSVDVSALEKAASLIERISKSLPRTNSQPGA